MTSDDEDNNRKEDADPNIDWRRSAARRVVLDDLEEGVLPLDRTEMPAHKAWEEVYQHLTEFHGVSYEQFRDRLNDHRKQIRKKRENLNWDERAVEHDRGKNPQRITDRRGKPVFYLTEAHQLLVRDVKRKRHEKYGPAGLRSKRLAYKQFDLKVFQRRIHQQVRREKFENYLELEREKKTKERQKHLKSRNPLPNKRRKKRRGDNN